MSPKQIKLVVALVIAVLALTVFLQNASEVTMQILFAEVKMRLAAALGLAFVAGLVTGFLAFSRWQTKKSRTQAAA